MEDEKEVYFLWGEFLKRSDIYCKYCEFAETNECFDSLKGINWKNDERLAFTVAVTKSHILTRCDMPFWIENNGSTDKKQFCSDKRLVDATRLNYIVFRNLYKII